MSPVLSHQNWRLNQGGCYKVSVKYGSLFRVWCCWWYNCSVVLDMQYIMTARTWVFGCPPLLFSSLDNDCCQRQLGSIHNILNLWPVHIIIFPMKTQNCVLCVVEPCVTVNNIKILSAAQVCFYGRFMLLAKIKCALLLM